MNNKQDEFINSIAIEMEHAKDMVQQNRRRLRSQGSQLKSISSSVDNLYSKVKDMLDAIRARLDTIEDVLYAVAGDALKNPDKK